ncbi:MAG: SlyX family protein [Puniceicoccales bacterium]|jgi:uncharacterized coiled-coil protein SlyX|nr:SlyX family protein [Puniceicoccales bacterium]
MKSVKRSTARATARATPSATSRTTGVSPEVEQPAVGAADVAGALAERVRELEIKVMFLERQVGGQDRAMLEQYRETERLRTDVKRLTAAFDAQNDGQGNADRLWENERPPHY